MAELGARSNLEGLLHAVAEFLQRRGLPRRLNKKASLKITRELNKRCVGQWEGGFVAKLGLHDSRWSPSDVIAAGLAWWALLKSLQSSRACLNHSLGPLCGVGCFCK